MPEPPAEDSGHKKVDATSLRALAHPLRVRLMELLWLDGPATSTGLAKRLGETSGTVSWHLRHLARNGFITEDTARGNKRERWWRVKPRHMTVEPVEFLDNPELHGSLNVFLYEQAQNVANRLVTFINDDWDADWYTAATASDWRLRLRPDTLRALNRELNEVVDRYKELYDPEDVPAGEDDEVVIVQLQSFPHRMPNQE